MEVASPAAAKRFPCRRTGRAVPLDEPRCAEPRAYCKWRTACPLHLLEKEAARRRN